MCFRQKELRGLMLQAISPDYLFYKIGGKGTDSVFKRAFSVLIPPLILSVHEREPLLSEEQLYSVAEQVLEYVYLEEDVRGYGRRKRVGTLYCACSGCARDVSTYNTKS